jgi:putative peptide zinc metalloprotease protein
LWRTLDREGRLVALYGLLAVAWLVIALNIGYRVYVDRVGGLFTGLWRSCWTARVLPVVVVAALLSPVVYLLFGWMERRWRRLRQRYAERRVAKDAPRRLDALRSSSLRDLQVESLTELAAKARVTGNVHYRVVEMHAGAQLTGRLVHAEASAGPVQDAPTLVANAA